MKLNYKRASLLTLARQRDAQGPRLVITVGLLYDAANQVLAPEQAQPWLAERFDKQPFDRYLKKSRGTFAIHGSAYALQDAQRQGMPVQVSLGSLRKTLYVYPPRYWHHNVLGWTALPGESLRSVALDLKHAYGGPQCADNPEGLGHVGDSGPVEGLPLAQIEDRSIAERRPDTPQTLASFLPLPEQSAERRRFMGTCDEDWQRLRAPFLPLDTDPHWFDEVAQDQCLNDYWGGDETWSATGMHPERGDVHGRLPGLRPRLLLRRAVTPSVTEEAPLDLDTVWLFPDVERVLLLYRCEIAVQDIDGEDIGAVGVVCEHATDLRRSTEQCACELWPEPATAELVQPEAPPPAFDGSAMIKALQASFDTRHQLFAAQQAEVLAAANKYAAHFGKTVDQSALFKIPSPDLAALIAAPRVPKAPFDSAALKAGIEKSIAEAKEAGHREVERMAKHMNTDAQSLYALAEKTKPLPYDPLAVVDQMPVSAARKADYRAQIQAGLAKAQDVESQIKTRMDALQKDLAAIKPAVTSELKLPTLKPKRVWTRESLHATHLEGASLSGEHFEGLDLSDLDLRAGDFKACTFDACKLKNCRLDGADLEGCTFRDCDFGAAQLDAAKLINSLFQRCCLDAAQLNDVSAKGLQAQESSWSEAVVKRAHLSGAQFSDCQMASANFNEAQLDRSRWLRCDLSRLQCQTTHMSRSQWHECLIDGADLSASELRSASWSKVRGQSAVLDGCQLKGWRTDHDCQLPDIRLDRADLSGASLQFSALPRASLVEARLDAALVSRCNLSDSNGYHLSACAADFTGSDLSRASWKGANLMDVRLRKVNLHQADLSNSNLHGAFTEGVSGTHVRLENSLLSRCRLKEDLANV
ncbi:MULTISPECIES: DUF2169 domain-containing protein [unclassified Pseudomonas]|uniref:DUF2169 domain-containing protein n=1 Tax=unclassified Pseudomonas TaxID=196821 RepID=UPI0030DC8881